MATWSLTLSLNGTSTPDNLAVGGPITDVINNAVTSAGQLTLATGFVQIAVPTSGSALLLYCPAANTNNILIANNSSGTNSINLGSNWQWNRLGVSGGTTLIYIACGSNTNPPLISYSFK